MASDKPIVVLSGSFDDMRSRHVRFIDQAARLGDVHLLLWSDAVVERLTGNAPKFPTEERRYFVDALRYVRDVKIVDGDVNRDSLPAGTGVKANIWAMNQAEDNSARKNFCASAGIQYCVITDAQMAGFPLVESAGSPTPGRKKVLVTGCYDWVHTGHVRFFEEVDEYGDVYAVVGHDANILLLKGAGHPQFHQDERRYMVQAIRFVKQCMISTGNGWLDAEPEIERIRPDIYAVNEDGDKSEKKNYCRDHGIEYLVLKRLPKPGLPRRQSTALRGF